MLVFESRHRRKDGSVFPVEVRGRPFWEGGRRLIGGPGPGHHRAQTAGGGVAAGQGPARPGDPRLQCRHLGSRHARRRLCQGRQELDQRLGAARSRAARGSQPVRSSGSISCTPTTRNASFARSMPTSVARRRNTSSSIASRHRDGTYRWMLARGTAIRDEAGKPIRLVGTRVDITEQKRVEEALARARRGSGSWPTRCPRSSGRPGPMAPPNTSMTATWSTRASR